MLTENSRKLWLALAEACNLPTINVTNATFRFDPKTGLSIVLTFSCPVQIGDKPWKMPPVEVEYVEVPG